MCWKLINMLSILNDDKEMEVQLLAYKEDRKELEACQQEIVTLKCLVSSMRKTVKCGATPDRVRYNTNYLL